MKLRRILACMMALLLVCSLPLAAFAEEYDLENGSISIEAKSDGQYVTQADNNIIDHKEESETVITQKDSSTSTSNTVTIKAEENTTAEVTLKDVNIDVRGTGTGSPWNGVSGEAAVQTKGDGNVTIDLDGENTVQSGLSRAGLEKNNGGNLTITDENDTAGRLEATGGMGGAGIGGGSGQSVSNITIEGNAEVTANGGEYASGIGGGIGALPGGGNRGKGSYITITDNAKVTANGGEYGAGIGGGETSDASNITIEGNAEVTANGGKYASGIGGGEGRNGSNITITGSAIVTAKGGDSGAGIGGGTYHGTGMGEGSNITVSGDAQVKAQGGEKSDMAGAGAAIGNGGELDNYSQTGEEILPNTKDLNEGWIATYDPSKDMKNDTPASLTYRDDNGNVITATENITLEAAQPATADAHGHEAGFKVGNEVVTVTTHYYTNYASNNDATCTKNGTETGKCRVPGCSAEHTRTVSNSKLPHEFGNYVPDADNRATCTKSGTMTATCSTCGTTKTVPDPIKEHDLGDFKTIDEATCQKEGKKEAKCKNCSYIKTEPIEKASHSYGEYVSNNDATCTSDGTKSRACIWCQTEDPVSIPDTGTKLSHIFSNYISDGKATCTQDGNKTAKCDHGCGAEDTIADVGSALGHSFTHYVSNNDATYAKDGTKTARCDRPGCDATDTITDPGTRLPAPLYRVVGKDGKGVSCETERKDGVLTITVDADSASLTGYLGGLQALSAQGIDTIVFVTNGVTSTFALADLLATMTAGDSYTLTHDGSTVTFTLATGTDISSILK